MCYSTYSTTESNSISLLKMTDVPSTDGALDESFNIRPKRTDEAIEMPLLRNPTETSSAGTQHCQVNRFFNCEL